MCIITSNTTPSVQTLRGPKAIEWGLTRCVEAQKAGTQLTMKEAAVFRRTNQAGQNELAVVVGV